MNDAWGSGSFEPIKNDPKISLKALFIIQKKGKHKEASSSKS